MTTPHSIFVRFECGCVGIKAPEGHKDLILADCSDSGLPFDGGLSFGERDCSDKKYELLSFEEIKEIFAILR